MNPNPNPDPDPNPNTLTQTLISLRVEQSNKITVYILPAAVRSTDPYSSASLTTAAINLPNQDGEVMRVELLATPNVQTDGLPEDPEDIEVLHVWTASPPSPPPPELAFGTAGQDCHQACEAQGDGRVCADLSQFDWTIFVSAAGLPDEVCGGKTQRSRCDMGHTPLWGDSFCYYCDQVARYTPTPTFKSVCSRKFRDRKRICPCRDAMPSFENKAELVIAVAMFIVNPESAEVKYGPISAWGVSAITDMSKLFSGLNKFDEDLSNWDTSKVTTMSEMFSVRSSPCTAPNLQPSPPLRAACPAVAHRLPYLEPYLPPH